MEDDDDVNHRQHRDIVRDKDPCLKYKAQSNDDTTSDIHSPYICDYGQLTPEQLAVK